MRHISMKRVAVDLYNYNARMYEDDYQIADWISKDDMEGRFSLLTETVDFGGVSDWLDVGCGPGALFTYANVDCNMVGIDVAESMVEYARGRSRAEFQVADADDLPFPDDSFDLVTMIGLLEITASGMPKCIGEACRVTRPNGIIYITTRNLEWGEFRSGGYEPDSRLNWFTVEELSKSLDRSGARVIYTGGYIPAESAIVPTNESHTIFIFAGMPDVVEEVAE